MHICHVPSVFFTITGLDTHLGKNTALRILASTSFDTSVVIASLRSFFMACFYCHTGKVRRWMLSLCSAKSHGILVMSVVIMEYLVNISKSRAFWSLNEDILKITILTTNMAYPSRKIRRIRVCTHQRPQRKEDQYAVSKEDQYAVLDIWHVNILEDIKH
ncbi:hypothetical protein Tco_1086944, partial [Tanacetum coccineum]